MEIIKLDQGYRYPISNVSPWHTFHIEHKGNHSMDEWVRDTWCRSTLVGVDRFLDRNLRIVEKDGFGIMHRNLFMSGARLIDYQHKQDVNTDTHIMGITCEYFEDRTKG